LKRKLDPVAVLKQLTNWLVCPCDNQFYTGWRILGMKRERSK
jgi:hypothetical protein